MEEFNFDEGYMIFDEQKINSWKELRDLLMVYGVDIKNVKEIWDSMNSPDYSCLKKYRIRTIFSRNIRKIVYVWEKNNLRFVLFSDKNLLITNKKNSLFNFYDKGFYEINGIIIRSKNLPENFIKKIYHLQLERGIYFLDTILVKSNITYNELKEIIENIEAFQLSPNIIKKNLDVNKNAKYMNKFLSIAKKYGIGVKNNYLIIDGKKIGLKNKNLINYIDFKELYFKCKNGIEDSNEFKKIILEDFALMLYRLRKGNIKLGNFEIPYEKRIDGIFLNGKKTLPENFKHLIKTSIYIKEKSEFESLQNELERLPITARKYIENGIRFSTYASYFNYGKMPRFEVTMSIEYKDGYFYAISPVSGKRAKIKNDLVKIFSPKNKKIENPYEILFLLERKSMYLTPIKLLRIFKKLFGGEEAIKIMGLARKNAEEIVKKASKLLNETIEKYKDRVVFGKLKGMEGFIVKGEIRNYFIERFSANVSTYPEDKHICIVESKNASCVEDMIISRILLLLNDSKLRTKVSTLDNMGEGDDENIELILS